MTTSSSWVVFFEKNILSSDTPPASKHILLDYVSLFDKVTLLDPSKSLTKNCVVKLIQKAEKNIIDNDTITIWHLDQIISNININLANVCKSEACPIQKTCLRILVNMKYEFGIIKRKKFDKLLATIKS